MISIDWHSFAPWPALIGGLLIGIAAAMLALFNGRIAGISGIIGGLMRPAKREIAWRFAFLTGLMAAPATYGFFSVLPAQKIDAGSGALVIAGLLVGAGTRYGSGCTSGHGICGLSRLSLRSLVATLAFMGAGFVTVFVARHLLHL